LRGHEKKKQNGDELKTLTSTLKQKGQYKIVKIELHLDFRGHLGFSKSATNHCCYLFVMKYHNPASS
jgi:hypothetical protein